MKFTKMHGCGNDYIYINGFTEKIAQDKKTELVQKISDRHFGIGGDGVIFINPGKTAEFEMEMYNADGSRSQMCGNGIRCVGKYVYDYGLTDKTEVSISNSTFAGTGTENVCGGGATPTVKDCSIVSEDLTASQIAAKLGWGENEAWDLTGDAPVLKK